MNSLAIIKKPRLTKGQELLFAVICKKIETDTKLVYQEAKDIWLNYVHCYVTDGLPYSYQFDSGSEDGKTYTTSLQLMTQDMVNFTVLNWLTRNIGMLVLKGYLTVLPALDLKTEVLDSK